MPKVSLMIHTASPDDFLANHGIPSYFIALIANLRHQTFTDFELVYVDTYYEENKANFATLQTPCVVKHVPIHPNHRYWYDQGFCYIAAAKNTGILYADGELLVTCDDAEFFPDQFLEMYWWQYRHGRYAHALHKRFKRLDTVIGVPVHPLSGDEYVNDHRWERLTGGVKHHQHGNWCYAGSSFSITDAVNNLNGFNERMDGVKGLEDCDFGNRLALLGRGFAMLQACYLHILDHAAYGEIPPTSGDNQLNEQPPIPQRRKVGEFIAVENYGMCMCALELHEPKANCSPVTPAHLKIIQRETKHYRHFDPLDAEHAAMLEVWLRTPTFDLAAEREALRKSPDWKW